MPLVLASPGAAPQVPKEAFSPLMHEWVGCNGNAYDLNDWASGVMLDNRGVEGLHNPKITKFTSRSKSIPGKRLRGWRAEEREVFWPLHIWSDTSSEEWLARFTAFFDTIHPGKEGTWKVTSSRGTRSLRLSGVFDESHAYTLDPHLEGWGTYGVKLEAVQPYWAGETVTTPWFTVGEQVRFIPETLAPSFHRSPMSTISGAKITNPGDVPAYPFWDIQGPWESLHAGVDGRVVNVFPLAEGDVMRLDTDPRRITATLNGTDVTEELGFQRFAPVQPGANVALDVAAVGTGRVRASLTPLYFRAV